MPKRQKVKVRQTRQKGVYFWSYFIPKLGGMFSGGEIIKLDGKTTLLPYKGRRSKMKIKRK